MPSSLTLSLTQDQHAELMNRLHNRAQGREALAFMTCGHRLGAEHHRFVAHSLHFPDATSIVRATPQQLAWRTDCLAPVIDAAEKFGHVIFKIHSHPHGTAGFSRTDDASDQTLFAMLSDAVEAPDAHGSAILLPDGTVRARVFSKSGLSCPVDLVTIVGDEIRTMPANQHAYRSFASSHATLFGSATYDLMRPLRIALVGASGTGSPLAEQLVRLGVGTLVLVDGDKAEERNLNRVYNMVRSDVDQGVMKVDLAKRELDRIGTGTDIVAIAQYLSDPIAIEAVAACDIIIGGVDTLQGRLLLSLISAHYGQPYIDLGVKLDTHPDGRIREVCGTVHYLHPGGGSLMSRGLFTPQQASEEEMARRDPETARELAKAGYIAMADRVENRPAVISVNTSLAAQAVTELLARLAPFREEAGSRYASVTVSFSSMEFICQPDSAPCRLLLPTLGRGDRTPLLGLSDYAAKKVAA